MLRTGQPVTFRGLARHAGVSLDFLYSSTALRQRIQQLRDQQRARPGGHCPAARQRRQPGNHQQRGGAPSPPS